MKHLGINVTYLLSTKRIVIQLLLVKDDKRCTELQRKVSVVIHML